MDDMDMMPEEPMPPMDDPNAMPPMDDAQMGNEDPNAAPPMDDPNAMPPMDDEPMEEPPMEDGNSETQEIDDIWNQLDTEDKGTLLKYGKSMLDDNGSSTQDGGNEPPMQESRKRISKLIDEALNDIFGKAKTKDRKETKLDGKFMKDEQNPFVSPINQ